MKKAINAVISAIVRTLLAWAAEWSEDAYFFLVIGDKTCCDVAWSNTEDLSCGGALAITSDFETAGAFYNLSTIVDELHEERLQEEDYRKAFENTQPEKDDSGWFSLDFEPEMNEEGGEA